MATWINARPIYFPQGARCFLLDRREAVSWGIEEAHSLILQGRADQTSLSIFETMLLSVILSVKPQLEGLQIIAFDFYLPCNCWRILVAHPDLPPVNPGEEATCERLRFPRSEPCQQPVSATE